MPAYAVEVQPDFLEKITRAKPVHALAELIWNSLDADACTVEVTFEYSSLGALSSISVSDNGIGMPYSEAPNHFRQLGGSWKKATATTRSRGRFLHGQDGRGRFKAFALGLVAVWEVTYQDGNSRWSYSVTVRGDDIRRVIFSDELPAPTNRPCGVRLTVSEPSKDALPLTTLANLQELTEIFALYLTDYSDVSILISGVALDPQSAIASRYATRLNDIFADEVQYAATLKIIEWREASQRTLYLCNDKGFPLVQVDRRFHVSGFQFSAYVASGYLSLLQNQGTVELAEMHPSVAATIDEARRAIKAYFRDRAAQEAQSVVSEWKATNVYPYEGQPSTQIEEVERQVFDIVAVSVARHLQDFDTNAPRDKALHLRLLRQAIEKSPEELQLILGEVLRLPKRKQEELADLLRDVSLSSIIGAAKVVSDRMRFLAGLESVVFDSGTKARLKERSQLHRIIAQNCWLFGEEYNLSVDDQSLTEVLRKHKHLLGDETRIDEPVRHISQERGIVDLMLSRAIRRHRSSDLNHLVVELKAPRVKIDAKEITQIEGYAFSVAKDERFRGVGTNWVFWVISDDYGDYAESRITDPSGLIYTKDRISIYVKTWAQVFDESRARLQFFQERLEIQADKSASLQHLQEKYAEFLKNVLIDDVVVDSPEDN